MKAISTNDAFKLFLEQLQPFEDSCILCGTKTFNFGVLEVKADSELSRLLKVPKGKTRVTRYSLCKKHTFNEKTAIEVENKIIEMTQKNEDKNITEKYRAIK